MRTSKLAVSVLSLNAFLTFVLLCHQFATQNSQADRKNSRDHVISWPQFQNFIVPDGSKTCHVNDTSYHQLIGMEYFPNLLETFNVPRLESPLLPRAMSKKDYDLYMRLLNLTVTVFEANNISYTISAGGVIGSYVMHDMLPWDDDLDILIHNDSKAKVIHLFKDDRHYGIQGYMNKYQMGRVIKLFFTDSEPTVNRVWNWPFLDVETYIEEGDQIRLAHRSDVERIYWPKSAYFPFHRRPFGPLWLYFPHDPAIYFKIHYNHPFYCQRHFKDHRHENWQKVIKADCERLTPHYPFVRRSPFANITQETLLLNGTELYTVYISEPYSKPKSKLGW